MKPTKIVILFFVLLISLPIFDFYIKPAYYDFTDGEGKDLAETILAHTIVLAFGFLISFIIIKKMNKQESEGSGDHYQ